ncbi:MAG: YrdB family protein [Planctomycetes bacterium]|nr:YrdB family protein [Planctomycetota bacterium]
MEDEFTPTVCAWNLALRFVLEVVGVIGLGLWGWHSAGGWLRYLLAFVVPVAAMLAWGTFNVRHDPSRSGKAPVPVPGVVRLLLELAVFGAGATAWMFAWNLTAGVVFAGCVAFQYATSWKRVVWLVRQ